MKCPPNLPVTIRPEPRMWLVRARFRHAIAARRLSNVKIAARRMSQSVAEVPDSRLVEICNCRCAWRRDRNPGASQPLLWHQARARVCRLAFRGAPGR